MFDVLLNEEAPPAKLKLNRMKYSPQTYKPTHVSGTRTNRFHTTIKNNTSDDCWIWFLKPGAGKSYHLRVFSHIFISGAIKTFFFKCSIGGRVRVRVRGIVTTNKPFSLTFWLFVIEASDLYGFGEINQSVCFLCSLKRKQAYQPLNDTFHVFLLVHNSAEWKHSCDKSNRSSTAALMLFCDVAVITPRHARLLVIVEIRLPDRAHCSNKNDSRLNEMCERCDKNIIITILSATQHMYHDIQVCKQQRAKT